jgi:hypothetical protein
MTLAADDVNCFLRHLFPPPALDECFHSGFARRRIPVRRRADFMMLEGQRPQRGRVHRRCVGLEDAADDYAAAEYVIVRQCPNLFCSK